MVSLSSYLYDGNIHTVFILRQSSRALEQIGFIWLVAFARKKRKDQHWLYLHICILLLFICIHHCHGSSIFHQHWWLNSCKTVVTSSGPQCCADEMYHRTYSNKERQGTQNVKAVIVHYYIVIRYSTLIPGMIIHWCMEFIFVFVSALIYECWPFINQYRTKTSMNSLHQWIFILHINSSGTHNLTIKPSKFFFTELLHRKHFCSCLDPNIIKVFDGLAPNKYQTISWTIGDLGHVCMRHQVSIC